MVEVAASKDQERDESWFVLFRGNKTFFLP